MMLHTFWDPAAPAKTTKTGVETQEDLGVGSCPCKELEFCMFPHGLNAPEIQGIAEGSTPPTRTFGMTRGVWNARALAVIGVKGEKGGVSLQSFPGDLDTPCSTHKGATWEELG